jgi:hypothetical protein
LIPQTLQFGQVILVPGFKYSETLSLQTRLSLQRTPFLHDFLCITHTLKQQGEHLPFTPDAEIMTPEADKPATFGAASVARRD